MIQPVSITSIASVSALGDRPDQVWEQWQKPGHLFSFRDYGTIRAWGGKLAPQVRERIEAIRNANPKFQSLDDTVLMAIAASRDAMARSGWDASGDFGVNLGSSRGATSLFEKHHAEFLSTGRTPVLTSPVTTLGNIASWVAQDLSCEGPEISHSITCSTSLHALLNGFVWLQSGMASKFIVGGSESPLTAFTIAQMQALKIYSRADASSEFPCRASEPDKQYSSMILGEAAAVACIESGISDKALAIVTGIGYATEELIHGTSISANADCLQRSMRMALGDSDPSEIDAIVLHAPGTVKGDGTELKAIEAVFGNHRPALTTTKWKNGHTFGASGMFSVELAVLMLQHQYFIGTPFGEKSGAKTLRKILVNSVGFGGNAVSVVLSRP